MKDLEHPDITQARKTGYPYMIGGNRNHFGNDYFGDEILYGDEIVVAPDGELLLKCNLDKYLNEVQGYHFQTID